MRCKTLIYLASNVLQICETTADGRLIRHVLAVRYVVTKLAFRHAFEAGPALHLARGTLLLLLSAFGFLLIAAIMTIGAAVAHRSLRQTGTQRATMGGAIRGW